MRKQWRTGRRHTVQMLIAINRIEPTNEQDVLSCLIIVEHWIRMRPRLRFMLVTKLLS